jgi:hypothetical protein
MTRKTASKKAPKKPTKKAAKSKPREPQTVYIAVRPMVSVNESFTEPDRVFATRAAAQAHADRLNRELRTLTNPFADDRYPGDFLKSGDDDDFIKVVKKLGLAVPKPPKGQSYLNWEEWWDLTYPDLTDVQRIVLWDALNEFEWYAVKKTLLED